MPLCVKMQVFMWESTTFSVLPSSGTALYSRNLKLLVPFFDRPSIGLQKIDKVVILYVKFHFSFNDRIVGNLHQNVLSDGEGKILKCYYRKMRTWTFFPTVFELGLTEIPYVFCIVLLSSIWENGWWKGFTIFFFFLGFL